MPSIAARKSFEIPLIVQMLACSFLWGGAFILLKLAGTALSPLALTAVRGLMGGSLIAIWMIVSGHNILPRGREMRDWVVLGFLQGVVPNSLTAYALTEISAGLTSMIQASTPLVVAVLAQALFASERLTPKVALGLATGFGGMVLLIGPAALGADNVSLRGVGAVAIVAVSYALGNLYVRGIPGAQPVRLALGQQLFSGLPTFAVMIYLGGLSAFSPALDNLPLLLVLGVFGTALPIVLYMNILKKAGPTIGSMNGYFLPPWTIVLGFVLLGEPVSLREIIATAIVLAGVAIVSLKSEVLLMACRRLAAMLRPRRSGKVA
ncbi:DMT family transporter [Neorhizobium galegae]|uniref:Transmembrane drug/metabolite transporter family protein n=1 Tax=Neorhizobium galegae bv. orientalis str. HAMBI 540 TaxID=1028800 RepID=A0A068SPL2_NEOGA|nr:DMT family transporter [Neorhizobium galegae]CDN46990.1 Transmembrane drug/metabolite transporter family protein [Neorhizobium galegae bv. orientalis str. HAMBI 540]CDZ53715.1 Transmembrane drug/metabolite transporter family protein [Neorhizobium galegae bv. orientalis]